MSQIFRPAVWPPRTPEPSGSSSRRLSVRLMKTRFSWRSSGASAFLCNQKQYINTVITGKDEEEILKAVKTMAKNGMAEGFIVLYSREKDPIISYLFDEGLLYVLVGKAFRNANQTIYVDNDNVLAGREAAQYLISLGHRRIAYLSGDHSQLFVGDRKAGCMLALTENGLPVRQEYFIEASISSEPGAVSLRPF